MKRILAIFLAVLMLLSLTACGAADEGKYVVGVCQYMPHDSLDQSTQGFQDALMEALGEDKVVIKVQNAAG